MGFSLFFIFFFFKISHIDVKYDIDFFNFI